MNELEGYIIQLKQDIYALIENKQCKLLDPEIQRLSQTLDLLLNEYYSVIAKS